MGTRGQVRLPRPYQTRTRALGSRYNLLHQRLRGGLEPRGVVDGPPPTQATVRSIVGAHDVDETTHPTTRLAHRTDGSCLVNIEPENAPPGFHEEGSPARIPRFRDPPDPTLLPRTPLPRD